MCYPVTLVTLTIAKEARIDGEFHLAFDMFAAPVDEEIESVELVLEVGEEDDLWLRVRLFHVIDPELAELARTVRRLTQ